MADNNNDSVTNGDTTSEFFDSTDFPPLKTPPSPSTVDVDRLNKTIADLERGNWSFQSRIAELSTELEKLRVEKAAELEKLRVEKSSASESSESNVKAAEAIAKRVAELETEVAHLHNDLVASTNDSSESNRKVRKLNRQITALKMEKYNFESRVKIVEDRIVLLVESLDNSGKLISRFTKIKNRELVGDCSGGCDRVLKQLKENKAMIAAVTGGAILTGGIMFYVKHSKN